MESYFGFNKDFKFPDDMANKSGVARIILLGWVRKKDAPSNLPQALKYFPDHLLPYQHFYSPNTRMVNATY